MGMNRVGDWIQTYSGLQFWPLDPRPTEVLPLDIAHALSHQCRFSGHTSEFYSVAQHSVLVSLHVSPEHALWGLLHDAGEAYLMDMPRPIKRMFPAYKEAEAVVMRAVCDRFGLPHEMPAAVAEADIRMLATEARDLMGRPLNWGSIREVEPYPEVVVPMPPVAAKVAWFQRLCELLPDLTPRARFAAGLGGAEGGGGSPEQGRAPR